MFEMCKLFETDNKVRKYHSALFVCVLIFSIFFISCNSKVSGSDYIKNGISKFTGFSKSKINKLLKLNNDSYHKVSITSSLLKSLNKKSSKANNNDTNNDDLEEECNDTNCTLPYGVCSKSNICVCQKGFADMKNKSIKKLDYDDEKVELDEDLFCQYQLKSRTIAILFEVFFPIGIGHFYTKRYIIGTAKMSFFTTLPLIFLIILGLCSKPKNNRQASNNFIWNFLVYGFISLAIIWYLVDIVYFAVGKYTDGNGFELY